MSTPPQLNSSSSSLSLSTIFPIKIVVPGVLVLSILFVIVLILYFRIKNQSHLFPSSHLALDPAVLNSLPHTVFSSSNSECAVCLSDLADGELGRLLPRCNHRFHVDCIDEWFLCNSTCPICRSSVDPPLKLPASDSGANSVTFLMVAENIV